jgi:nitroreductase
VKQFSADVPLADETLRWILQQTQTTPSSFNLQPCKVIVVRNNDGKELLASTMLGMNAKRVRDAPATIIFLADCCPTRNIDKLMKLESNPKRPGGPAHPSYLHSLPSISTMMVGGGVLAQGLKRVATHLLSPIKPMPQLEDLGAWANKNAGMAAQTLMLAAAAAGVGSSPMEGFDARRLKTAFGLDGKQYTVPLVVSLGTPVPGDRPCGTTKRDSESDKCPDEDQARVALADKVRFPFEDIFYEDSLSSPMHFDRDR